MGSKVEITTAKLLAVLITVSVVSAGIGAGVTVATLNISPVAPGAGTVTGSNALDIHSQELQYTGNDVTSINVSVNNTKTYHVNGDIHVAFKNASGGTVVSTTVTGIEFRASTITTTTVTLPRAVSLSEFNRVEVTVEQTG